jgi:hypothetical protein
MNGMANSTACIQFEKALEQSDEPLSASAAAHLQDCVHCSVLWSDLETIRATAQEWGAEEPEPPARVWIALRAQLEAEGLIREPAVARRGSQANWQANWQASWLAGWLSGGPRLAMAGAYLSLLLVGAVLLRTDLPLPAVSRAGARVTLLSEATSAEAELGQTLDSDMKRVMASLPEHNASLASSLQQNLGIVDNMIAVCEKSVREQPSDPIAREYLYGAYQQKAVLLATALDRSTLEEK